MSKMDFSKVLGFLKSLTSNDKILIVFHRDADGLCSAVIARKALERAGLKPDIMVTHLEKTSELESVAKSKYNAVIFLDLALDHLGGNFWNGKQKILLIDHHPYHKDLNSKNVVHFNSHFFLEGYLPASYLVYKIFSEIAEIKDVEWISVLGTIADYGYDDCRDLLDKYISVKEKGEMFETKYGKAAGMIGGVSFFLGFEKMAEILIKSESVDKFLGNKKILNYYEKFSNEIERLKKEFFEKAEKTGNVYFAHIESKIERIQSSLLTRLSTENPEKVLVVYHKVGENIKLSGRAQIGYDLGTIFMKAAEFAGGSGGGHKPAAGAMVPASNIKKFKKKVAEMIG
jgi:single-stranded DNA-specific DHH superfamily exonuclease